MALHEGDLKAGVIGLALGAVFLLAVTFTIVKLTNAAHAKHETPAAQGTTPSHTAPAGQAAPAPAGSH